MLLQRHSHRIQVIDNPQNETLPVLHTKHIKANSQAYLPDSNQEPSLSQAKACFARSSCSLSCTFLYPVAGDALLRLLMHPSGRGQS